VTVAQAPVPKAEVAETASPYDVVEKTIGEMRADMEAGRVTSQQITWAYLDRIAVYDKGQLGFNAYEVVASDAMAQALAADRARAAGKTGPLLGIPIALKNLYDTKDMPTTNGSLTFAGFQPARDAFQVARLREAGAVLIGKAALEEYATSGNYSNDAWGQVWNAFNPSKSAIASSGGSAVAVAASLAAGALGSQTGDSLYGPASAASLVTLRGTDGLESGTGIMPLSWLTDFGGAMTRSVRTSPTCSTSSPVTDPDDPTPPRPTRTFPPTGGQCSTSTRSKANASATSRHSGSILSAPRARPTPRRRRSSSSSMQAPRSSRWAPRSAARTRRPRPPTTRPATRIRKAGCSTSTRIPSW
jgi:amidase